MVSSRYKNPDILVVPLPKENYRLLNKKTGKSVVVDKTVAGDWFNWRIDSISELRQTCEPVDGILETAAAPEMVPGAFDGFVASVSESGIKHYREHPDLTALFNTRRMAQNNPLLALGAYGSLVWCGIEQGVSVGILRQQAATLFGADEVLVFIQRLMRLGFVEPLQSLLDLELPPGNVIKEFPASEVQFTLPHTRIPWYCLWEVCTECDLDCRICYLPEHLTLGPNVTDRDRVIDELKQSGIFYVSLLGGEALLRPDLEEIVSLLRQADIFVKLITNGNSLTRERASTLDRAGLNQIEISFDGLSETVHDWSRGTGAFKSAERALLTAQECGIPRCGMVLTLHQGNLDDLVNLPEFMCRRNVRECYISLYRKTGASKAEPLSVTQISGVHQRLAQWREQHPDKIITLLNACTCGKSSAVIGADLSLRACPFSESSSVGTIGEQSLAELWESMESLPPVWCRNM